MPVEEQKYGRPGEVADVGRSNVRLLTCTEQVMTEEYSSCKAGCMGINMVLRKPSWRIWRFSGSLSYWLVFQGTDGSFGGSPQKLLSGRAGN